MENIKALKPIERSTGIISISGNYYSQLTITTKKTFPEWQNYQNQNVNINRSVWFKMKSRLSINWALRNNLSPSSSDNLWPVNSPGKMVNLRIRSSYLYGAFIRICMAPVSVFVWCLYLYLYGAAGLYLMLAFVPTPIICRGVWR